MRSYQSTGSYRWVFIVLATRCHTKGPTNLQFLINGFLMYCLPGVTQKVILIYRFLYTGFHCIVFQVSHKRSYESTGSYIQVFSLLSPKCHTKGPTNIQVLIYDFFTVLSTRCYTKGATNLQFVIYRFLVYCLPGVTQKVLPISRYLYTVFSVLPTRCHTKGPTNLQVLIYLFLPYCIPGVTQKVLPIYSFLYKGL